MKNKSSNWACPLLYTMLCRKRKKKVTVKITFTKSLLHLKLALSKWMGLIRMLPLHLKLLWLKHCLGHSRFLPTLLFFQFLRFLCLSLKTLQMGIPSSFDGLPSDGIYRELSRRTVRFYFWQTIMLMDGIMLVI